MCHRRHAALGGSDGRRVRAVHEVLSFCSQGEDKLQVVKGTLQDVKQSVVRNIEKALDRGEGLDEVCEKSAFLARSQGLRCKAGHSTAPCGGKTRGHGATSFRAALSQWGPCTCVAARSSSSAAAPRWPPPPVGVPDRIRLLSRPDCKYFANVQYLQ